MAKTTYAATSKRRARYVRTYIELCTQFAEIRAADFGIAISKSCGFHGAQDMDEQGRNIYHHMFTAMKYSQLFGEIALRAFEPDSEPLAVQKL